MKDKEINICGKYTCKYSIDAGCFLGRIEWYEGCLVELFLLCSPCKPTDMLLIKLAFETLYRERDVWTRNAINYACDRFIPYFHHVVGSDDDLMEDMLQNILIPCSIEFAIDGSFALAFESFSIGNRQSDLIVNGQLGRGFTNLKDGGEIVPFV